MKMKIKCWWCLKLNKVAIGTQSYCWHCGHRVDVAQIECTCDSCETRRRLLNAGHGAHKANGKQVQP